MKLTLVQIEWVDSQFTNGWLSKEDREELFEDSLPRIVTVGILVKETTFFVVVASSIDPNTIGQAMKIPKAMILHRLEIGIVECGADFLE